jgi:hypothetical protein
MDLDIIKNITVLAVDSNTQFYYNHRDDTKYCYLSVSNCGDWIMHDRSYQEKDGKQIHKNYLKCHELFVARHKNCIKCI